MPYTGLKCLKGRMIWKNILAVVFRSYTYMFYVFNLMITFCGVGCFHCVLPVAICNFGVAINSAGACWPFILFISREPRVQMVRRLCACMYVCVLVLCRCRRGWTRQPRPGVVVLVIYTGTWTLFLCCVLWPLSPVRATPGLLRHVALEVCGRNSEKPEH